MACQITFKTSVLLVNNMQFSRLIDFGIEVGEQTAGNDDRLFVAHMVTLRDEIFFPGCGIDIVTDFPLSQERKFWSRVYFNVSRFIFERKVGIHEHNFWQAQAIHQSHALGLLFEEAVRDIEPRWTTETMDTQEFDLVVNGRNPANKKLQATAKSGA